MQKHFLMFMICASIAFEAGAARAAEDLTVVSSITTNGQPSGSETSYISADHIRTSHAKGNEMILDLKSGVMTTLDDRKKTYYVVTKQDMEAMQAKMAERMKDPKVKQGMAMFQNMSASMTSTTEVKKTGVSRKVGGYACDEWLITMGQMMSMTECVTSELKYPTQSWEALMAFNESMRKSMSGFGPSAKSGEEFAEKMKSIKGFPVASTTTLDGITKTIISSEVTEVRRTPIPTSTWDVPAGFTKVDNPMLQAFQERGR
jgi:hypothetical protein